MKRHDDRTHTTRYRSEPNIHSCLGFRREPTSVSCEVCEVSQDDDIVVDFGVRLKGKQKRQVECQRHDVADVTVSLPNHVIADEGARKYMIDLRC